MSASYLDPRYEEILQKYEQRLSSMETVMGNMAVELKEYQRRFRFHNKAVKFLAEYLLDKFGFNLWLRMRSEGPNIDSIEEDVDLASLADQYFNPIIYADRNKVVQPIGTKVKEGPRIYPGLKIPMTSAKLVVEQSEAQRSFTRVYDDQNIVLEDGSLGTAAQHPGTTKRASHDINTSIEDRRQEYIQIPPKVAKTNFVFENESQSQNSNPCAFVEPGPPVSTGNASGSRSSASSQASSHSLSRSSTPVTTQITPPVAMQPASTSTAHPTASSSNQSSYSIMSTQTDTVVYQAPPTRRSEVIIHKEDPNIIEADDKTSFCSKSPSVILPKSLFEIPSLKTDPDINEEASNREGRRRVGETSTSSDAPHRSYIKPTSNSHVAKIAYDVSHPSYGQLGYITALPYKEEEIPVTSLPRKSKNNIEQKSSKKRGHNEGESSEEKLDDRSDIPKPRGGVNNDTQLVSSEAQMNRFPGLHANRILITSEDKEMFRCKNQILVELNDQPNYSAEVSCRTIRLGTYRSIGGTDPLDEKNFIVRFTKAGIIFEMSHYKQRATKVELIIPKSTILYSGLSITDKATPFVVVRTGGKMAEWICKKLGIEPTDEVKFMPTSRNACEQNIVFYAWEFSDEAKSALTGMPCVRSLTKDEANELLIKIAIPEALSRLQEFPVPTTMRRKSPQPSTSQKEK